ncbi:hypothetical protein IGM_01972 [Bacillus cereus HuB4-4]|uniref:Peptidase C39-like domain-containing protein n=1 Tax=Bacillus cereus HuB4-4 TaxID=1053211 RepID=A0A9W5QWS4_BACCE|nr:C39 family peptidase [Bacillus cereus]EOP91558.1 hypothetical protein IGM_01972 [Bacillus cereus HuB4-4]
MRKKIVGKKFLVLTLFLISTICLGLNVEKLVGKFVKPSNPVLSVSFVKQKPELPRGCEVTSLAMLLNYGGIKVSKMELAEKIDKVPYEKNGFKGDMNKGFLGDMYSFENPGLGVNVGPIYTIANQYLPGKIINLTGYPVGEIYKMIDKGSPVWVITNAKFKKLSGDQFRIYQTKTGPMIVTYQQHSVVITGYTNDSIYINDPLAEMSNKVVNRKQFEESWIQMGSQAISIQPK